MAFTNRTRILHTMFTGDAKPLAAAVVEASAKTKAAQTPIQQFGRTATGAFRVAGLAAAGFSIYGVKSFIDFDKAMTESKAVLGDMSDTMEDRLAKAAIETSKIVTFSATEMAEAYYYLALAGFDAEQALESLPVVAKFAQAGQFDLSMATDLLTDAQSALALTVDDAAENMENMVRVSDVLVGASTMANASVQQFSEALTNKAGAALKTVNKDIEEGVAVLAYYADQGVKGSTAGESLAITIRDIARAAYRNTEEFEKLGIQVFDTEGNLKNMADVVREFEDVLGDMSDAQTAGTLETLGLTRSVGNQLRLLMGGSEDIREYENALRSMGGVTEEIAEKQLDTFSSQWILMKNNIQAAGIQLGSVLVPIILNDVFPAIEKLATFLHNYVGPALAGVGAAISDYILPPLGTLTGAIGENETAMQGLGVAIGGLILWGGAVQTFSALAKIFRVMGGPLLVQAVVGIWSLIKGVDQFIMRHPALNRFALVVLENIIKGLKFILNPLNLLRGAFNLFSLAIRGVIVFIKPVLAAFKSLAWVGAIIVKGIAAVAAALGVGFATAAAIVVAIIAVVVGLGYIIYRNWSTIASFLVGVWDWIRDAAVSAWNMIGDFLIGAWNWIRDAAVAVWNTLFSVVSGVISGLISFFTTAADVATTVFGAIWDVMTTVFGVIATVVGFVIDVIGNLISEFLNLGPVQYVIEEIGGVFSVVGEEIGNIIGEVIETFQAWYDFISMIVGFIVDGFVWLWNNMDGIFNAIGSAVEWVIDIFGHIGPVIGTIIGGIGDIVGWVINIFIAMAPFVITLFQNIASGVGSFVSLLIDGFMSIVGWFQTAFSVIATIVGVVIDLVVGYLSFLWDVFMTVFSPIADVVTSVAGAIWDFVEPVVSAVYDFIQPAIAIASDTFHYGFTAIRAIVGVVFTVVRAIIENGIKHIGRVIGIGIDLVQTIWSTVWDLIGGHVKFVFDTIIGVVTFAIRFVSNIIQFALNLLQLDFGEAWDNISNIVMAAWDLIFGIISGGVELVISIWDAGWNLIGGIIEFVWGTISSTIRFYTDVILDVFWTIVGFLQDSVGPTFETVRDVIVTVWGNIRDRIGEAWAFIRDNILDPARSWLQDQLLTRFQSVRDSIIGTWDSIRDGIQTAWNNIRDNILDPARTWLQDSLLGRVKSVRDGVIGAFESIRDRMSSIWDGIIRHIRSGVNGAITILNGIIGGLERLINALPGVDVTLPTITPLGASSGTSGTGNIPGSARNTRGFESGGIMNAADLARTGPFITDGIRAIVGEGNRSYPEYVIPTDPKFRNRALGLFGALGNELVGGAKKKNGQGPPMMALGGIIPSPGDIWDGVTSAAGDVFGFWDDLIGFITEPMVRAGWNAFEAATNPALNSIPNEWLRKSAHGTRNKVREYVLGEGEKLGDFDMSAVKAGAGVQRWAGVAAQALAISGQSTAWLGDLLTQMQHESGGNPTVVNKWDSNWVAGHPSVGLMQVIGPTYSSMKHPQYDTGPYLYGTSVNPLSNILAGIRWTLHRYGSLARWRRGGFAGYESGAWDIGSDHTANIHRGEMVVPANKADKFRDKAMDALLEKDDKQVNMTNNFYGITDTRKLSKEISHEFTWGLRVAG